MQSSPSTRLARSAVRVRRVGSRRLGLGPATGPAGPHLSIAQVRLAVMQPPIAIGCMRLSTAADRDEARGIEVLHAALDAGVTLFDTANAYCLDATETGHNERLIARALAAWRGDRSGVRIATKGGLTRPEGRWEADGRARALTAACESSLIALGVERIDLYQLHAPDPRVPLATSVRALHALRRRGLIDGVGLCNVTVGQIEEAQRITGVDAVQVELSLWHDHNVLSGVVEFCTANGIPLLAYRPLGWSAASSSTGRDRSRARAPRRRSRVHAVRDRAGRARRYLSRHRAASRPDARRDRSIGGERREAETHRRRPGAVAGAIRGVPRGRRARGAYRRRRPARRRRGRADHGPAGGRQEHNRGASGRQRLRTRQPRREGRLARFVVAGARHAARVRDESCRARQHLRDASVARCGPRRSGTPCCASAMPVAVDERGGRAGQRRDAHRVEVRAAARPRRDARGVAHRCVRISAVGTVPLSTRARGATGVGRLLADRRAAVRPIDGRVWLRPRRQLAPSSCGATVFCREAVRATGRR